MNLQLHFAQKKKEFCVRAEEVCLVFVSLFIKSCNGSIKFFKESDRFGKVNVKPLTDSPVFVEYLSGKGY